MRFFTGAFEPACSSNGTCSTSSGIPRTYSCSSFTSAGKGPRAMAREPRLRLTLPHDADEALVAAALAGP